jgi:hypothetical protein
MKNYIHPITQLGSYKYGREDSVSRIAAKVGKSRMHVNQHRMPRLFPEIDDDEYPTEETLNIIAHWPITSNFAITDMLEYIKMCWWGKFGKVSGAGRKRKIAISTGGWSGNESIISAMQQNTLFWALCWQSSRVGGHYEFLIAPIHEKKIEKPVDLGTDDA